MALSIWGELAHAAATDGSRSTGLGVCFLTQESSECWWIAVWGSDLMLAGMMFIGAFFKGEPFDDGDKSAAGLGVDSNKIKTKAASKVVKSAAGGII